MKKLGSLTSMLWSAKQLQEILNSLSCRNKQLCGIIIISDASTISNEGWAFVLRCKKFAFKVLLCFIFKRQFMYEEVSFTAECQNKSMQIIPEFTIFIMNVVIACRMKILLLFTLFFTYSCDVQHVWSWFSSKFHFLSP